MKKKLISLMLVVLTIPAYCQTITVKDKETGKPLVNVTLMSENPKAFVTTNEKGQAEISAFKGSEKIDIRTLGYKTEIVSYKSLKNAGYTVKLLLTGISLNEFVISASKFEEKQEDVAQKIQVLRSSELQNMNQTSTADVIAGSGNIMVQKSQLAGGSPVIRGFETNKVLIVVDGMRMNNAIYRGGHLQNVITLDNSIMERIELVFGPGSVVYGSDALGGVMHFYTKKPVLSNGDSTIVKTNAYARYFSAASGYAGHLDFSLGGKKLGSLTSVTYTNNGDLRQGAGRNPYYGSFGARKWYVKRNNDLDYIVVNKDSNLQIGSAYQQYDVLQKFLFRQSAKLEHIINLQYSTSSDIPRYDRLTQLSGNNPKYAVWYYGPQKRFFSTYSLHLNGKSSIYDKARFILGYQKIEESRNSRKFNSVYLQHQIEQVDVFSFNADLEKQTGKNEFRYGAEASLNLVNSTAFTEDIIADTSAASETRYPDGGSTMTSLAIYGTHTREINDNLILNDGLRLTNTGLTSVFNDKTFFPFPFDKVSQNNTAVNGNLALIFASDNGWRTSLACATGFRAPNVDDMSKVFESVPGSIIVPNPNLHPEYTYNGEVSISKTLGHIITVSALGYYTVYKNALTVQPAKYEGKDSIIYEGQMSRVTSTVNAGEAYIYGAEGSVSGNLNEFISINVTINYTYGRIITDTTDYPLDHIPPVFGKLGLSTTKNNFRGEFFLNYSGWKRLKDYNLVGEDNIANATPWGMPAWFTLNARLSYSFVESLNLQFACENILDQNYRVFASNISAPGRNFIITLRYTL